MSIKVLDDELIIIRRWFRLTYLPLSVVFFLLFYGFFLSELPTLEFLINPLTWIMLGLAYYTLIRFVNSTVIRVSPERLLLKQGPLPPRQSKQFQAQDIRQLYIKQHVRRGNKSKTTIYPLYLSLRNGQSEKLGADLGTAEEALFLEQEIERYLGITDLSVRGEHESSVTYDFSGWRGFASTNNLHYIPGKLLEGYRVYGNYLDYALELIAVRPLIGRLARSRLTLAMPEGGVQNRAAEKQLSLDDVAKLFAAHLPQAADLSGKIKATDKGKKLIYEQDEVDIEATRLQRLFDTLHALIKAYPDIIELGGQVIPVLRPIAIDSQHPTQAVAGQLIQEIAPTTAYLSHGEAAALLCPQCLMRCAAHEVELSWLSALVYFGCRNCHQSKDFLTIDEVICVLDDPARVEPVQQRRTLSVNWLPRQTLFDFNAVEIIQATDEAVERFAIQVGNDTDPARQPHYKQMQCTVSPACQLSDNTLRILQRTFGQVERLSG